MPKRTNFEVKLILEGGGAFWCEMAYEENIYSRTEMPRIEDQPDRQVPQPPGRMNPSGLRGEYQSCRRRIRSKIRIQLFEKKIRILV